MADGIGVLVGGYKRHLDDWGVFFLFSSGCRGTQLGGAGERGDANLDQWELVFLQATIILQTK